MTIHVKADYKKYKKNRAALQEHQKQVIALTTTRINAIALLEAPIGPGQDFSFSTLRTVLRADFASTHELRERLKADKEGRLAEVETALRGLSQLEAETLKHDLEKQKGSWYTEATGKKIGLAWKPLE